MATVNVRNGLLYFDFRYKDKRCREYTKLQDTVAHRKRMEKICERIEAEITLGTFVYRNYFPDSSRAKVFDELEVKQKQNLLAGTQGTEAEEPLPSFAEFTETWLVEKRIEWRGCSERLCVTGLW